MQIKHENEYEEKYRLVWRKSKLDNIIGEVRNYVKNQNVYRRILITHNDEELKAANYRLIACTFSEKPRIVLSSLFLTLPLDLQLAGIWHEVGHIHYEHYLDYPGTVEREKSVKTGKVIRHEREADLFALNYVPKEQLIEFLKWTLGSRPKSNSIDRNTIGAMELMLRIELLEKL